MFAGQTLVARPSGVLQLEPIFFQIWRKHSEKPGNKPSLVVRHTFVHPFSSFNWNPDLVDEATIWEKGIPDK